MLMARVTVHQATKGGTATSIAVQIVVVLMECVRSQLISTLNTSVCVIRDGVAGRVMWRLKWCAMMISTMTAMA